MTNTTTVTRQGVNLQVYTCGDNNKVPVVLVHGYPNNHSLWQPVADRLAKKYFATCYDVRGAGASDAPRYLKHRENVLEPEALHAICPVQLIAPTRDNYVGTQLFEDPHKWVDEPYRRDINANHWVPLNTQGAFQQPAKHYRLN